MRCTARLSLALVFQCWTLLILPIPAGAAGRYNLISIVTDDQAHWSIGAYGNRESRTPNLDRLASEGALFLNAFTCTPVCSPSRAAFLTGRLGTQLGITDWIAPKEAEAGVGLPPEAVTWSEILQRHGYVTALLGKWHLGGQPRFHPTRHGFDHFYGFLGGGVAPMNPILEQAGQTNKFQGAVADLLMDAALQFVETNRARPFALLLHFREPHLPYTPVPEEDAALFKDLDPTVPESQGADTQQVKKWTREYYASIHLVDRNLGRLWSKLDELGLAARTIVLFTSDHGYMIGHHGLHSKGNAWRIVGNKHGPARPNMFEESIRIPLLVRWPGVVAPGTVITQAVSNLDTYPTVLSMLDLAAPRQWRQHGKDFSPLLRGRTKPDRDAVFAQYDLHNGTNAQMRMIRTSQWKLVRHYEPNGLDELYDLRSDPSETRNRHGEPGLAKITRHLQRRLSAWQRAINDPVLREAQR